MPRLLLSVAAAVVAATVANAQPPKSALVTVKEVEVRSGPSDRFPPTAKLSQNDRVEIRRAAQNAGWLEIVPPPGSFSWVNAKDVQAAPNESGRTTLTVSAFETELRAGAAGNGQPLSVRVSVLRQSTKLIARGPKVNVAIEKSEWWPVECISEESRYIPASAVQKNEAAKDLPALPKGGAAATKEPPQWALAEQAQREGRLDDAERLYLDIVREHAGPGDFELSLRANNRAQEIRLQRRTMLTSRPGGNSTLIPPQPGVPAFTPNDRLPPRPPLPSSGVGMNRIGARAPAGQQSTGPGWLRRSGFQIDRKQTYALESANGQLRVYVTAEPGIDLESHLNRPVELYGTFEIRGDVRGADYMRVMRIVPLR